MLTESLLILAAAAALFLGYVAMLPRVATVSRAARIDAPPETVFPLINTLRYWRIWSPWAKLDPNAKTTLKGPKSGPNAAFSWAGNKDVGTGMMTIIESEPNDFIRIRIDFDKPYQSIIFADFFFQPEEGGTRLTWSMTGERPFLARLMSTVFRSNATVGKMFERGLANLNETARQKME